MLGTINLEFDPSRDNNRYIMASNIINWIFGAVFFVTGVLNVVLVHPVPGIFYLLLSLVYFPPVSAFVKKKLGLAIPFWVKVALGLVVLWGTLAVGDLAEILGL